MIRRVIQIDEEKCNGCGACADACPKSIIKLIPESQKIMPACGNMHGERQSKAYA